MPFARAALLVALAGCGSWGCARAIRPCITPTPPTADALLVLPGFGYGGDGERAFRALAPEMAADGFDLYLPAVVARGGLEASRDRLARFVREARLERYARVHVFAFIAGAWMVNPLVERELLPNLATIVYDRSPYQERAPRIARGRFPVLTWLRYGNAVFDLARTPYSPVLTREPRIGIVVETVPSRFVRRHRAAAGQQGPYAFGCGAFHQPYDDCIYVAMDHDELYTRFAEVWPEVRAFIRTGAFTGAAERRPPS